MQSKLEELIREVLSAETVTEQETIQSLWSGYGKIVRLGITGTPSINSVVLKHIIIPGQQNHPRGWNSDLSHQRKLKSYLVEMKFYENFAQRCNDSSRVASCYHSETIGEEQVILLEDLDAAGFPVRKSTLDHDDVKVCLSWLANFHATFVLEKPEGLWEVGTYWHLATRPDEYDVMLNQALKEGAQQLDSLLSACQYQTLVHGDAKVANFCFSEDGKQVAAVDFQYVGGGCGMKDVIYLLGSCLDENECELYENELLSYYFEELKKAMNEKSITIDFVALEKEWRALFPIAWTDFSRFLDGWMPTHPKNNSYTKTIEKRVLSNLK